MGRFSLISTDEKIAFASQYIPAGFQWRLSLPNETDPFTKPRLDYFGIYTALFTDVGLRLPLEPLLLDFIEKTRINFADIGLNIFRVVLGVAALNRKLGLNLGLDEIFYCYDIQKHKKSNMYFFRARAGAPELIKCLPTSQKGKYDDAVVIMGGPLAPEGTKFPRSGGYVELPSKPPLSALKVGHINAALGHEGYAEVDLFEHPRACHILLGYESRDRSVNKRSNAETWVGVEIPDRAKLLLYAEHGVENRWRLTALEEQRKIAEEKSKEGKRARAFLVKYDQAVASFEAEKQSAEAEEAAAESFESDSELPISDESSAARLTKVGFIVIPSSPEGERSASHGEEASSQGYSPSPVSSSTDSERVLSGEEASTSNSAEMKKLSLGEALRAEREKKRAAAASSEQVQPKKAKVGDDKAEGPSASATSPLKVTEVEKPAEIISALAEKDVQLVDVDSPALEKAKKKKKKTPEGMGVKGKEVARVPWVPEFAEPIFVDDTVTDPEVAVRMMREMSLPKDIDIFNKKRPSELRQIIYQGLSMVIFVFCVVLLVIVVALILIYHLNSMQASQASLTLDHNLAETARKYKNEKALVEVEVLKHKNALDSKVAELQTAQGDLVKAKKKVTKLVAEKGQAEKEAQDAEAKATLAETRALAAETELKELKAALEQQKDEAELKGYNQSNAENKKLIDYWRPKILQFGFDLGLDRAGVPKESDLRSTAEVPAGWWGDDREPAEGMDFNDFLPDEEEKAEDAAENAPPES